jgi:alpha-L-fucosidase
VPAFAPRVDIADSMTSDRANPAAWSPYTEWYQNSLRFPESPVAQHHAATYGDRPYESFADDFQAGLSQWDPHEWAATFAAAGARYVVLVTKHHDGYCLWPTAVPNPNRPGWHSERDIVGELGEAVRAAGMRFGLYYSGGYDWTFDDTPMGKLGDVLACVPRGEYPAYADAQVRELIARYRPDVLWNDILWPDRLAALRRLVDHYDEAVPDGLINDRFMPWHPLLALGTTITGRKLLDWGATRAMRQQGLVPPKPPLYDVRTPEYAVFDGVRSEPWECVRGMDHSFGFNQESTEEDHLTRPALLELLTDVVAKGGNLLLNVGPRGRDATIPERQRLRLEWLGEWLAEAGPAVYETRPWVRPTGDGGVWFTARGDTIHVLAPAFAGRTLRVPGVAPSATASVTTPAGAPLAWQVEGNAIRVDVAATNGVAIALHGFRAA